MCSAKPPPVAEFGTARHFLTKMRVRNGDHTRNTAYNYLDLLPPPCGLPYRVG
jgi:hypothetical protein